MNPETFPPAHGVPMELSTERGLHQAFLDVAEDTAIGQDFGLLLNFGSKSLQFKRKFLRPKDDLPPDLLT